MLSESRCGEISREYESQRANEKHGYGSSMSQSATEKFGSSMFAEHVEFIFPRSHIHATWSKSAQAWTVRIEGRVIGFVSYEDLFPWTERVAMYNMLPKGAETTMPHADDREVISSLISWWRARR